MSEFTNVTVWTEDSSTLAQWYVEHAGLRIEQETSRFSLLRGDGGAAIGFHVGEPVGRPQCVQFHIQVDDVNDTVRRLAAAGVEFDEVPSDKPWGVRSSSCADPAGHSVEFFTPLAR